MTTPKICYLFFKPKVPLRNCNTRAPKIKYSFVHFFNFLQQPHFFTIICERLLATFIFQPILIPFLPTRCLSFRSPFAMPLFLLFVLFQNIYFSSLSVCAFRVVYTIYIHTSCGASTQSRHATSVYFLKYQ